MTTLDGWTALSRANATFTQRLRLVRADDWPRPTPCPAWDVRALVNHVIGGARRYTMLLHGASAESLDPTRTEDHLGPDPLVAFTTTADELAAAFREDGALARIAHHPAGDRTGADLLAMRVLEITAHAWDLAHALDVDDALDPAAVAFALSRTEVIDHLRERGYYAAPTGPSRIASSPQDQLLRLAGRPIAGDRA